MNMANKLMRVNNGNRKIYVRNLAGLNWGRVGAINAVSGLIASSKSWAHLSDLHSCTARTVKVMKGGFNKPRHSMR